MARQTSTPLVQFEQRLRKTIEPGFPFWPSRSARLYTKRLPRGPDVFVAHVRLTECDEATLREQLAKRDQGTLEFPTTGGSRRRALARITAGYVFPYAADTMYRHTRQAARAAGLPPLTVHDIRRTFATRCADDHVPMKKLQSWMGHSSINTTAEHYIHHGTEHEVALLAGVRDLAVQGIQTPTVGGHAMDHVEEQPASQRKTS